MAELIDMETVRAACYAEPENDPQLEPIKNANEAYVLAATGYVVPESGEVDPRVIRAVLDLCYLDFWPGNDTRSSMRVDSQGNIRASITRRIKQLQAELAVTETEA